MTTRTAIGRRKRCFSSSGRSDWAMPPGGGARRIPAGGGPGQIGETTGRVQRVHSAHLFWAMGYQAERGGAEAGDCPGWNGHHRGEGCDRGLILMICFLRFLPPDDPQTREKVQGFVKESELFPQDPRRGAALAHRWHWCAMPSATRGACGESPRAGAAGPGGPLSARSTRKSGLMLSNLADLRASMDGYRNLREFRTPVPATQRNLDPG